MYLNLHILKEDLTRWDLQGTLIDRPTVRRCAFSVFCTSLPKPFREDVLYIMNGDLLPEKPNCSQNCSIVCIGLPPESWLQSTCNLVYTESMDSPFDLINDINERFHFYQQWENSLQEALDLQLPPQELAQRSLPVIQNTIYAQGAFYRVLCKSVPVLDDSVHFHSAEFYSQYKKDYDTIPLGGILNVEDINNLISDAEYNDAIHATEPTIYSGEFYGFRSLFYNIYIDNSFVARVVLDEIVKPFTDKDFALIQVFGNYLKKRLMTSDIYFFDRPREMEEIFQNLIKHQLLPEEKIIHFLNNYRWNVDDTYVCFILKLKAQNTAAALEPLALQLAKIIMQDCYTIREEAIIFVCNLTQLSITRDTLYSTILPYLRDNMLTAGISTTYRDFKNLYYYYHQALIAEQIGQKKNPMHWYFKFEEYQLEYMIQKCTEKTIPEILIPEGLRSLMEYDRLRKHNYTETLRLYLMHDRNIAQTIRAAYMHRNTFLYQIGRIQEILNMNLDDPDTRLLLLMTFRILDAATPSMQDA